MVENATPHTVLSQRPAVAIVEAIPTAAAIALGITLFAGPFVGFAAFGLLISGAVSPGLAIGGTFAAFFALVLITSVGGALLGAYTAEYRIYDDHVEVISGIVSEEFETIPLDKVHHAKLSQGLVEGYFGVGDVKLETKGSDAADVTLQNVTNAEDWYERLRPVRSSSQPLETVTTSVGAILIRGVPVVVLMLGTIAVVAGGLSIAFLSTLGISATLVGGLVGVGFVVGLIGLSGGTVVNARNTRYEFFDDHIERRVDGPWKKREFVHADNVKSIEFTRGISERLFDVGTVEVEVRWVSDAFKLESIRDAKGTYEKLRQAT